jgi:hypothetical protein
VRRAWPGSEHPGRDVQNAYFHDLGGLRTISQERDDHLAVGTLVTRPGTVRVGASLTPG